MFDELKMYKNNGHFFFKKGDSLREVSKSVPDIPGVYYIIRLSKGRVELVYIGMSDIMMKNGKLKVQFLLDRFICKQDGVDRQEFFDKKIEEEQIDGLDIYWFATFDDENNDLPIYVEGVLMQQFFDIYGKFPEWNCM